MPFHPSRVDGRRERGGPVDTGAGGRGEWRELFTLVPRINDQEGAGDEAVRVYLGLHDREWTGPPDCLLILIQMN